MKLKFKWNKAVDKIAEEATGGNRTKLFIANESKRFMDPYVPFLNGPLHTNISVGVDSKGGYVHYKQPYAKFQYYGKVMVGVNSRSPYANYGERKEVTSQDIQYNKFRHPLATSQWDKAMKTARMNDLLRATQNYVKKGV